MKHLAQVLAFALLLAGCAQQSVGNTGDLVISGQVRNWQTSFGATLTAVGGTNEELGSGPIDSKGEFDVTVSPPFYTLGNIEPCQNDASTVVSTPESLRVSSIKMDIAEQEAGSLHLSNERGFAREVINVYADQAGTVQGQVECTGQYTNTARFNLSLVQGWNLVLIDIETVSETSLIATYSTTNAAAVADFNWFAYVP